jgi:hypothetical protein
MVILNVNKKYNNDLALDGNGGCISWSVLSSL